MRNFPRAQDKPLSPAGAPFLTPSGQAAVAWGPGVLSPLPVCTAGHSAEPLCSPLSSAPQIQHSHPLSRAQCHPQSLVIYRSYCILTAAARSLLHGVLSAALSQLCLGRCKCVSLLTLIGTPGAFCGFFLSNFISSWAVLARGAQWQRRGHSVFLWGTSP